MLKKNDASWRPQLFTREVSVSGAETLISAVFTDWRNTNLPTTPESDAWELFTSWLLLRQYDANLDEIQMGIVDGSDDGGIDSVFTIIGGTVAQSDHRFVEDQSEARKAPEGIEVVLVVIQAKKSTSFKQDSISRLYSILPRALDLAADIDLLKGELNEAVREQLDIFRKAYRNLLTRRPSVSVQVHIISRGDVSRISPNVSLRSEALREEILKRLPSSEVQADFLGADELLARFNRRSNPTHQLECSELILSGNSYIALVRLSNYANLILDEDGGIRRHLFEANVRDFQGEVAVNKEIYASLEDSGSPEFWWLNNGVTILCDEAHGAGKTIAMKNIQIVNGLQTSHNVARWFVSGDAQEKIGEQRQLLVRIIVESDAGVRDKIIRATNRQTPVADASLRATDEVQRRIEMYFETKGLYYDRRKGFHRNLGRDPGRIVSIPYLGQAVYSIAYGGPEVARGKPNSLLAEDSRYKRAFDPKADIEVYYACVVLMRAVDDYLHGLEGAMTYWQRKHISYFVAFAYITRLVGKAPQSWRDVADVSRDEVAKRPISQERLDSAYRCVTSALDSFSVEENMSSRDATKRQGLTARVADVVLGLTETSVS
ncbi:AIPR family protein [Raineyella sp. LH-20]|uniref:AIPR family protein n=1 Tax=Raineyella sp. LH-20 TaxID=3081204 RepID=UPI002954A996|nr:AIPR family protein [Raineyella sp. LH-20]WOP19307.1 AIPR family protein [Raineyella sp. LH-20]